MQSNKQSNKAALKEMLAKKPNLQYIYIKRWGMDESIIDVPIKSAIQTINMNPFWEIVVSIPQIDEDLEQLFNDDDNIVPELEEVAKKDELIVPDAPCTAEVLSAIKALDLKAGDTISNVDLKQAVDTLKKQPDLHSQVLEATATSKANACKCSKCVFVAKTKAGLSLHYKKHV